MRNASVLVVVAVRHTSDNQFPMNRPTSMKARRKPA
jgi:hypothetical protein